MYTVDPYITFLHKGVTIPQAESSDIFRSYRGKRTETKVTSVRSLRGATRVAFEGPTGGYQDDESYLDDLEKDVTEYLLNQLRGNPIYMDAFLPRSGKMSLKNDFGYMGSGVDKMASSKRASRLLKYQQVVDIIKADSFMNGSTATGRKSYADRKDIERLHKILLDGVDARDHDASMRMAITQAKRIKDWVKALRRGRATSIVYKKNRKVLDGRHAHAIATVFYSRALSLLGLGKFYAPATKPAPKKQLPEFDAPPIPKVPMTASGWQLYSGMPGAETAAKGLGKVMATSLKMLGKHVSPYKTDAANAKVVEKIMKRIAKARYNRSEYGAGDTSPRWVAADIVIKYLKSFPMSEFDFPNTFAVANDYW